MKARTVGHQRDDPGRDRGRGCGDRRHRDLPACPDVVVADGRGGGSCRGGAAGDGVPPQRRSVARRPDAMVAAAAPQRSPGCGHRHSARRGAVRRAGLRRIRWRSDHDDRGDRPGLLADAADRFGHRTDTQPVAARRVDRSARSARRHPAVRHRCGVEWIAGATRYRLPAAVFHPAGRPSGRRAAPDVSGGASRRCELGCRPGLPLVGGGGRGCGDRTHRQRAAAARCAR